jgi:hypothetical protein
MSPARQRRMQSRAKFLAKLRATQPEKFRAQLDKRTRSWMALIAREANHLPSGAFRICDTASAELTAFGAEGLAVAQLLANECCRRLAPLIDSRLYRLSNTEQVCERIEAARKASAASSLQRPGV